MFDKLKKLKKLKKMQKSLSKEKETCKKKGVKVTVNGKMEVESVSLNEDLDKKKQEKILASCVNEALKNIKKSVSSKMSGQLDL